jgi:amino acid adenylation domain-containing protein
MDFLQRLKNSLSNNDSAIAFCILDKFYSYQNLFEKVIEIQFLIQGHCTKKIGRIGVVTNNDIETYASLIACWFSGFSYVPLNPLFPVERNNVIVKEAGINVILDSSNTENPIRTLNNDVSVIETKNLKNRGGGTLSIHDDYINNEMYVLFTSGSTGVPKGVSISFANLDNFVTAFECTPFKIGPTDKCLQMFELTFDVSISSFLIPLLNGGAVYTVSSENIKYIEVLKTISKYELTSLQIVPSIIRLGKSLLPRINFSSVKNCILTGEATTIDLIPIWKSCLPYAQIYNFYGPTEATIYCSYLNIDPNRIKSYNNLLAIGTPMKGVSFKILNEEGQEVAGHEKGELIISGHQVTKGYTNSDRNSKSFLTNDLNGTSTRFYRSGDLCFKDSQECFFYCGRLDNQIKIQGFRVELSEIEFSVRERTNLNNIVLVSTNKQQLTTLILVVETIDGFDKDDLIDYLKHKLPQYMIPDQVKILSEFPLNASGKTDRNKIKQLVNELI